MEVEFQALIKLITIKSLESGDKEAEMKLRFRVENETLDKMNRLHVADDEVTVIITKREDVKLT